MNDSTQGPLLVRLTKATIRDLKTMSSVSLNPSTFQFNSEKQFPAGHRLEAFCPTADLLALVDHQNNLDLYRLSWERHWTVRVRTDAISGFNGYQSLSQNSGIGYATRNPYLHSLRFGTAAIDNDVNQAKEPSNVNAVSLAWQPDGQMIAVGLSNGQINVYDYRDGSLAYKMEPSYNTQTVLPGISLIAMDSIQYLKWTDIHIEDYTQPSIFNAHQYPMSILESMPFLSPVPQSSVQQKMAARMLLRPSIIGGSNTTGLPGDAKKDILALAGATDEPDEESGDVMNVLIAGDSHGCFKLRLFAGFETYPVSLTALLKAYGLGYIAAVDILQMDISLDLSELTFDALVSYQHLSTESDEVGGKRLVQITVTSDLLHRQSREIRVLGLKRRPIINLLKYISDSLRVLEAEFKRISQLNEDCTDSLQRALTNNGEATTPTYEFLQLLVTGLPSPSMDYYLQQELRRDGLKRWNESVRAAHTNIHRVAFECMIPACERLLIHLSDILGCSRWGERYRPLRLEEAAVRDSIKAVGDFVGLIEHLFLVLKVEIKRFSEFENWLERVLEAIEPTVRTGDHIDDGPRVFPPVDYQAVSEYLQSSLSNVGLNAFFRDGNEGSSKEAASLPTNHVIENMHSKLPQSSGSTAKKKSSLSLPLDRHLSLMTRCCLVIFEGPAEAISKSMKVAHTLELLAPAKQSCRRLRLATRYCYYEPDPWYTLALYLAPSTLFPEPSLCILRTRKKSKSRPSYDSLDKGFNKDKNKQHREDTQQSSAICLPLSDNRPQSSTHQHQLLFLQPFSSGVMTRSGQKRKASLTGESIIASASSRARTKSSSRSATPGSPLPTTSSTFDALAMHSPTPDLTSRTGNSTPVSAFEGGSEDEEEEVSIKWNKVVPTIEVAFFSLQEHGWPNEERPESEISVVSGRKQEDRGGKPTYDVRDICFIDDNTLGVLLNSSNPPVHRVTTVVLATNIQQQQQLHEQFLVSIPLQSSGRPFQSISHLISSDLGSTCLLDQVLPLILDPSSSLTMYTLPINKSRAVAPATDPTIMSRVESGANKVTTGEKDDAPIVAPTALTAATTMVSDGHQPTELCVQEDDPFLTGPCRIAINERDSETVIGIFGPSDKDATILQGAGKISIFEL